MFGWIQKWRERRWRKQRLLFPYWDGETMRRADPFRLWREAKKDPDLNSELAAPLIEEGKEPETTRFVEATAALFGLHRWSDGTRTGLTDWEVLNVMASFYEYIEAVKKKFNLGPTSPPPTA